MSTGNVVAEILFVVEEDDSRCSGFNPPLVLISTGQDFSQAIKILGWCPAAPVLTHEEVSLQPWMATLVPLRIKMHYGVDILHRPASHPIFTYWVG